VFLCSTQFNRGVVNIWGSVISVYLLATGVKGLELVGAPFWIPDLFNGAALIVAVALSKELRVKLLSKRFRRTGPAGPATADADAAAVAVAASAAPPTATTTGED
jgi:ribose transport system permease protein